MIDERVSPHQFHFDFYDGATLIGSVRMAGNNNIIAFIEVKKEMRVKYYGTAIIQHLINKYGGLIVEEVNLHADGFWKKSCVRFPGKIEVEGVLK